jgi:hypothetical protein
MLQFYPHRSLYLGNRFQYILHNVSTQHLIHKCIFNFHAQSTRALSIVRSNGIVDSIDASYFGRDYQYRPGKVELWHIAALMLTVVVHSFVFLVTRRISTKGTFQ